MVSREVWGKTAPRVDVFCGVLDQNDGDATDDEHECVR